eukprot:m.299694 g.299694  ORF g.299694 m.299694 type:complete len:711 (-) comp15873_c0_seq1:97-2229(-)
MGRQAKARSKSKAVVSAGPSNNKWLAHVFVGTIAIAAAIIYSQSLATFHENAKFFSALETNERMLSFKSEQAFYYSFYKDLVDLRKQSVGWLNAVKGLTHDTLSESPSTINALSRFNIYPEVVVAWLFDVYQTVYSWIGVPPPKSCSTYTRQGLPSMTTCVGNGVPEYFYVNTVFGLQGLTIIGMIGTVWLLSHNSLLSVLVLLVTIPFNLEEMTRVMWTPPLRESFGFPFLMIQMLAVVALLQQRHTLWKVVLFVFTLAFCLSWQFAGFVLVTQMVALLHMLALNLLPISTFSNLLMPLVTAWVCSLVLQFCPSFLTTSLYTAALLVAVISMRLANPHNSTINSTGNDSSKQALPFQIQSRTLLFAGSLFPAILITKFLLTAIFGAGADTHIFDILRTKFDSSFSTFDTQLYTCAAEFDFMRKEYRSQSETLLLPMATCAILAIAAVTLRYLWAGRGATLQEKEKPQSAQTSCGVSPAMLYVALQGCAFFAMAALIMRLKLLSTPFLIVVVSVSASPSFWSTFVLQRPMNNGSARRIAFIYTVLLISGSAVYGVGNINRITNRIGEFNDAATLELMEYVAKSTPRDASFAGSMVVTSAIKCVTSRPIINHPHYENAEVRNRTQLLYQGFAPITDADFVKVLDQYNTRYFVLDASWCFGKRRSGCNVWELYSQSGSRFCKRWFEKPNHAKTNHFQIVFQNKRYRLLKVVT